MDKNRPIIKLSDISFAYHGGGIIHDKINFEFFKGDRIGLIGPNGSGKTTLFHIIMGLLKPSSGIIEIFGRQVKTEKDFRTVRHKIGFLFQDPDDQLFSPTVLEDVAFGPLNQGKTREQAIKTAEKILNFLGLNGFQDRITYKLSGGEKRLVSLATILAMEPEVLLLDEPAGGLDEKTKNTLIKALKELGQSYILISHDIDLIFDVTDSIYSLKNKKIIIDRKTHPHHHVHTHPHGSVSHRHG